jgi:CubicO group peptidase (beta-lactamase class C family)
MALYVLFFQFVAFAVLTALGGCQSLPKEQPLDGFIKSQMERGHIPGLVVAVVKKGGIVWSQGYGWANMAEKRLVTPDSLFHLASISKLVTGTAAMQLVEEGLLDLDADINKYLPFSIRNPNHPDAAITARMLLSHVSSIRDPEEVLDTLYTQGVDSPISLHDLLTGLFTPEGRWYRADKCFYAYAPGEKASYSDEGFTLLGYLVEVISGAPFDQYCKTNVFAQLGMTETSWYIKDLESAHIAMPYEYGGGNEAGKSFIAYGQYGYPDYPSGQVRTSATQWSHFMAAFMNQGTYAGAQILRPETVGKCWRYSTSASMKDGIWHGSAIR